MCLLTREEKNERERRKKAVEVDQLFFFDVDLSSVPRPPTGPFFFKKSKGEGKSLSSNIFTFLLFDIAFISQFPFSSRALRRSHR